MTLAAAVAVFLLGQLVADHAIVVSGESMEPGMHTGDLVVVWPRSQYSPGDEVAYRIPQGGPGAGVTVIHRVVEEVNGSYVMLGDNNENVDPWRPTAEDVIGKRLVLLPNVGRVLLMLRQPGLLGPILAGVMTSWLLLRPERGSSRGDSDSVAKASDRLDQGTLVDGVELSAKPSNHEFDPVGSNSSRIVPREFE